MFVIFFSAFWSSFWLCLFSSIWIGAQSEQRTANCFIFHFVFYYFIHFMCFGFSIVAVLYAVPSMCIDTCGKEFYTDTRSLIPKERWNIHAEAPKQSNSNCRIVSIFSTVVRISFFVLKLCSLLGCFVSILFSFCCYYSNTGSQKFLYWNTRRNWHF